MYDDTNLTVLMEMKIPCLLPCMMIQTLRPFLLMCTMIQNHDTVSVDVYDDTKL